MDSRDRIADLQCDVANLVFFVLAVPAGVFVLMIGLGAFFEWELEPTLKRAAVISCLIVGLSILVKVFTIGSVVPHALGAAIEQVEIGKRRERARASLRGTDSGINPVEQRAIWDGNVIQPVQSMQQRPIMTVKRKRWQFEDDGGAVAAYIHGIVAGKWDRRTLLSRGMTYTQIAEARKELIGIGIIADDNKSTLMVRHDQIELVDVQAAYEQA